jgi:hypothetical protein
MRDPQVKAPAPDLHMGSGPTEIPASAGSHPDSSRHAPRHRGKPTEPAATTPATARQPAPPADNGNRPGFSRPRGVPDKGHQDLHAISRQHVHRGLSAQVTVPQRPHEFARIRACCGTSLRYNSKPHPPLREPRNKGRITTAGAATSAGFAG